MSIQNKVSKAILQYLIDNGQVRTERLRRVICDPPPEGKNICTPKIFYKYLADLVESKRVKKFNASRNEIYYSTPDWIEYQNIITQDAVNHTHIIQKKFEKLQALKDDDFDVETLNKNNDILHGVFMDIMYMHNWATLAKLRNPKETSTALDNILRGTVPDLLQLFATAIGKFGKTRERIIEDLVYMQRVVREGSENIHSADRAGDDDTLGSVEDYFPR